MQLNLIGKNIARLRRQRGWTREELAIKLQLLGQHIICQTLVSIETRHYPVTDIQIVLFSEILSAPIKNLVSPVPLLDNREMLQTKHCITRISRKRRVKKETEP